MRKLRIPRVRKSGVQIPRWPNLSQRCKQLNTASLRWYIVEVGPLTRYTLQPNSANIMKGLVWLLKLFLVTAGFTIWHFCKVPGPWYLPSYCKSKVTRASRY